MLGSTSTVTGMLILGATVGGALGGLSCSGANLGGLPLETGAGPFWPPPPPAVMAVWRNLEGRGWGRGDKGDCGYFLRDDEVGFGGDEVGDDADDKGVEDDGDGG